MSFPKEFNYLVIGINGPNKIPFNILSMLSTRDEVNSLIVRERHKFEEIYVITIAGDSYAVTITKPRTVPSHIELDDIYHYNTKRD